MGEANDLQGLPSQSLSSGNLEVEHVCHTCRSQRGVNVRGESCLWIRWHYIHLGLVNEMSLFPQNALQKGLEFKCYAEILSSTSPDEHLEGVKVEVRALSEVERKWTSNANLTWPGFSGGRGALAVRVCRPASPSAPSSPFLLKIGVVRGPIEDTLHVLPLLVGPFSFTNDDEVRLTGEEMLYFHRQLHLPRHEQSTVALLPPLTAIMIRESPEIAIPGKIWDSALFASSAALQSLLVNRAGVTCPNILDLSSGTGICGIWLAAVISSHFPTARIIVSDLEEAVTVMQDNIALNRHKIKAGVTTEVRVIRWGNMDDVADLEPLDIVVACDLIYESELLPLLVETLDALTTRRRTRVIIGYKQRGLTKDEKEKLWETLSGKFKVEKLPGIDGCMDRECMSDAVGVELWQLWKP